MGSSSKDTAKIKMKDDNLDRKYLDEVEDLPWTPDQEILLLYSLHGYKPVGLHKHARMLAIQERFSSAMNKNVSCKAIWKKLNTLYDLEALDEAEAEADAIVAVETDFSLPEIDLGELMKAKISGRPIKLEKIDFDYSCMPEEETKYEIQSEPELSAQENKVVDNNKETLDTPKGAAFIKDSKKESLKKGPKKKELTPTKDSSPVKKDMGKETTPKRDVQGKKEAIKELKKGGMRDEEKKDIGKKGTQENKKDTVKEEKKDIGNKVKRDSADKKVVELTKKDAELKKIDQKKVVDVQKSQRAEPSKARSETPKQLRNETPKRTEAKILRSETPKPQKSEGTPKPQRVEVLKKESSADKKKEVQVTDKKVESKSPEKSLESRGAKLRTRGKETESEKPDTPTGSKRERSRDSISKTDAQSEEPMPKKGKIAAPKGRPTRNSIEPQQKPSSPSVSPTKRRTRLL